jgi:hypothetical protein
LVIQEDSVAKCWEQRGCDEAMQAECLHAADATEKCPARCNFAQCYREAHAVTSDPALIFDATVDRTASIKESCDYCAFFLTNGPRTE